MGVFSRLSDIINSNINSILDKAEDPEKIIRMVIQEMEDTLIEVRSSAAKIIADQKDAARQMKKLQAAADEWERKAALAIKKGREDLARGALLEKKKVSEMQAALQAEIEHLDEAFGRHDDDVRKLESKLREARAKKATIEARHTAASNQVRVRKNLYDNRISDAFDRFDKVEQRIDRLEGEAEAMAMGQDGGETLEQAFRNLESDDEREAELNALKSRVHKVADAVDTVTKKKPAAKKAKAKAS